MYAINSVPGFVMPGFVMIVNIHHIDVIMGTMASQITSLTIVLLNRLFGCRSKQKSKLRVTGLCAGNSPGTGEFPAQMASNAENVSIWWCHHVWRVYPRTVWALPGSRLHITEGSTFVVCLSWCGIGWNYPCPSGSVWCRRGNPKEYEQ